MAMLGKQKHVTGYLVIECAGTALQCAAFCIVYCLKLHCIFEVFVFSI